MLDILAIRDRLNQLPFRDGKRQVLLGRISDKFPVEGREAEEEPAETDPDPADTRAVLEYLHELESELGEHDLMLCRDEEHPDRLYAVQKLKRDTGIDVAWMRDAMHWTSRITTVVLEMVVPGVIGMWLDQRLGTRFLALLGFAVGVPVGMWHLIQMTTRSASSDVD